MRCCASLLDTLMAVFTDLPTEVVEDIIFYVLLCEQYTLPTLEGFTMEERSNMVEVRAKFITDYSKLKVTTGSFVDGVLAVHMCPRNDAWFHRILHRMFYEHRCNRNSLLTLSLTSKWL